MEELRSDLSLPTQATDKTRKTMFLKILDIRQWRTVSPEWFPLNYHSHCFKRVSGLQCRGGNHRCSLVDGLSWRDRWGERGLSIWRHQGAQNWQDRVLEGRELQQWNDETNQTKTASGDLQSLSFKYWWMLISADLWGNCPKPRRDDLKQRKITMPGTQGWFYMADWKTSWLVGPEDTEEPQQWEAEHRSGPACPILQARPGRIKLFPRNLNGSQDKALEYL